MLRGDADDEEEEPRRTEKAERSGSGGLSEGENTRYRGLIGPESPGVGAGRTEEKGARQKEP